MNASTDHTRGPGGEESVRRPVVNAAVEVSVEPMHWSGYLAAAFFCLALTCFGLSGVVGRLMQWFLS